jgi:hypothetical protein
MTNPILNMQSNPTTVSTRPSATIIPTATRWPLAVCVAWLALAAIETVVGVTERWPSQFGGTGDPDKIASQWITMGTAISPPLFLFIAVILGGALAFAATRRPWRVIGGGLITLVGLIGVVATLGELLAAATPDVPRGVQWSALIGTALSLALAAAGVTLVRAADRQITGR